jgi:hypothetical protein
VRILLAALALAAPIHHETYTSAHVTARLAYRETAPHRYAVSILVVRRGKTVFNATVPAGRDAPYGAALAGQHSVTVADLEADGEPEILVDLWSQGRGCCLKTLVYRWLPKRRTYVSTQHTWGAATYRLADLRGDGTLLFQSGDPRFAGTFASGTYARLPLQVWEWRHVGLVDVTRQFTALVRADATAQSNVYANLHATPGYPLRGAVAAWAADEALLGQGAAALRHVLRLRTALSQPPDAKRGSFDDFVKRLRTSLRAWGYLR